MSDQIGQLVERTSPNSDDYLVVEDTSATDNFRVPWSSVQVPTIAQKTADESLTSGTNAQNDDHLSVSVAANTTYKVDLNVFVDGGASGSEADFSWTVPSGVSGEWGGSGVTASNQNAETGLAWSSGVFDFTSLGGGQGHFRGSGYLAVGSTAGTLQLQTAAPGTSSITVKQGSTLEVQPI